MDICIATDFCATLVRVMLCELCVARGTGWLNRMATNERSMEEFQAVHNIILDTLRVSISGSACS